MANDRTTLGFGFARILWGRCCAFVSTEHLTLVNCRFNRHAGRTGRGGGVAGSLPVPVACQRAGGSTAPCAIPATTGHSGHLRTLAHGTRPAALDGPRTGGCADRRHGDGCSGAVGGCRPIDRCQVPACGPGAYCCHSRPAVPRCRSAERGIAFCYPLPSARISRPRFAGKIGVHSSRPLRCTSTGRAQRHTNHWLYRTQVPFAHPTQGANHEIP